MLICKPCMASCEQANSPVSVRDVENVRPSSLKKSPKSISPHPVSLTSPLSSGATRRSMASPAKVAARRRKRYSFALQQLPNAALMNVLSFLDVASLSACQPCRSLRELLCSDNGKVVALWQALASYQADILSGYDHHWVHV